MWVRISQNCKSCSQFLNNLQFYFFFKSASKFSSSPNAYLLINVLNSKRILMKTKAFKENLHILSEKILSDGKILSVQVCTVKAA